MTAEIAILNRSAVALAADSAVTLSVRGQTKIYDSVDKLFQLSPLDPVGIMIFGAAEYMGIPIETLIKKFRQSEYCKQGNKIEDYAENFFSFLTKEVHTPKDVEDSQVGDILYGELEDLKRESFKKTISALRETGTDANLASVILSNIIDAVNSRREQVEKKDVCKSLKNISTAAIKKRYRDVFDAVYKEIAPVKLTAEQRATFDKLSVALLRRNEFSEHTMGLVFAGFGLDEIFPSLICFQCDTLVCGNIKRIKTKVVDIDRLGTGAHIEPFAQREMVDRFLGGIDPSFDAYLQSAVSEALSEFSQEIIAQFPRTRKNKREKINNYIEQLISSAMQKFYDKSQKRREDNFSQKVMDMVLFMPKSELAQMAESLVNLTSIKRRVSAEEETVRGAIDVAVISKGDGFVWIKRKHYFDPLYNPRYFASEQVKLQAWRDARNGKVSK